MLRFTFVRFIRIAAIFAPVAGHAQLPDYHFRFAARVIDDSTGVALRDCYIVNKTLKLGTVSDEFGNFTLTANRKDSIEFSLLGYGKSVMAVEDSMYSNDRAVRLKPVAFQLPEVGILRFPGYSQFKHEFLNTKEALSSMPVDPVNRFEITPSLLPGQGGFNLLPFYVSPVTYLYHLLSREGRHMRYYMSLIDGTAEHFRIGEKFNGELVRQLTGLEDDELVRFMSSCYFSKKYLLYVPQEEINREIMRKFREYQSQLKTGN
ncbi:MAG: carboxypeptidase-like regulatory domain-containing protein [Bacteroidales bacterium]|jgi:hypothetical protein|nr:carboxypeptidase-like regulatory domain-containing protein [Bacteroidales bacterium]